MTVGEGEIVFPEGFSIPPKGQMSVALRSSSSQETQPRFSSYYTRDHPIAIPGRDWTGSVVDLGPLAVGEHEVTVKVTKLVEAQEEGSPRFQSEPVAELRGRIRVAEGARAVCRLESANGR